MLPAHKTTAEAADVNMDVRHTASNVRLLERVLQPLELDKLMRLVDETLSSKTAVRR